jgi:hypothetical protein
MFWIKQDQPWLIQVLGQSRLIQLTRTDLSLGSLVFITKDAGFYN